MPNNKTICCWLWCECLTHAQDLTIRFGVVKRPMKCSPHTCLQKTHIFLPHFASSLFSVRTHSCSLLHPLPRLLRQGSPLDGGLQRSAVAVLLIPPQEWITKWKWPRGLPGPLRSARSCSPPSPALFPKVLNPRRSSRDPRTELACLWLLQICQLWVN